MGLLEEAQKAKPDLKWWRTNAAWVMADVAGGHIRIDPTGDRPVGVRGQPSKFGMQAPAQDYVSADPRCRTLQSQIDDIIARM